ncbi:MAG TPA: hypothetical protein VGQ57_15985 [Polyangiaceae bacterium]|jgi:hypothetical protein|nr:hypothetical protein [Polyangiaceae bacterium]
MTSILMAAAVSGMLAGAQQGGERQSTSAGDDAGVTPLDKHACKGQNACKGQGGCKTDKHACKGQNACKGQGGCKSSMSAGGSVPRF